MEGFILHAKAETLLRLEEEKQSFGGRKPNVLLESWLKEEQGLPSQIMEMVDRICSSSTLERFWKQSKGEKKSFIVFDMYGSTKDVERNFIGPKSYLRLSILDPEKYPVFGGAYTGVDSKYNEIDPETGLLKGAEITLRLGISTDKPFRALQAQLRSPLTHELIHIYEDYNRRHLNRPDIFQAIADRGYTDPNSPDGFDQELKYFTYLMDSSEQKAFIGEAVSDVISTLRKMEKAGKLDRIEKIRNIDNFLPCTEFWGLYSNVRDWVEKMQWDRLPVWKQKALLTAYNSLVQGQGRAPKNYNQLVKKIKFRWSEFDKNLKVKVGQAISKFIYPVVPTDPAFPKKRLSESIFYQAY